MAPYLVLVAPMLAVPLPVEPAEALTANPPPTATRCPEPWTFEYMDVREAGEVATKLVMAEFSPSETKRAMPALAVAEVNAVAVAVVPVPVESALGVTSKGPPAAPAAVTPPVVLTLVKTEMVPALLEAPTSSVKVKFVAATSVAVATL
jgi:hypothetical protein